VIERNRLSSLPVHLRGEVIRHSQRSLRKPPNVRVSSGALLGVLHDKANTGSCQLAGITDLAARLRIERCAIEHDLTLLARIQDLHGRPISQQRHHTSLTLQPVITLEVIAGGYES